jgi:ribosome-binding factor A
MKRKQPSRKDLLSSCENVGPEDGLDPKIYFRTSSFKATNRKAVQLCSEVARILGHALAWEMGDDFLSRLDVASVVPAPDSTRLLVTVTPGAASAELSREATLDRLQRAKGKLRALVAEAIHRRRVPDLAFRVEWTKEVNQ